MATSIPSNESTFTQAELVAATAGVLLRSSRHSTVRGVVSDSRAVSPGHAFVALRGAQFDGGGFVRDAIERGAHAVIVKRGTVVPPADVTIVEVDDSTVAFGDLARFHLRRWRRAKAGAARLVALTGSAGKTTTKELLASILDSVGPCHATKGNLNNRVGVPAVALAVTDERFVVLELGMSVPGEIAELVRIVEPDVALLLNVGVAHAEGFGGSRDRIAAEKGAIFAGLGPSGVAVFNADDDAVRSQIVRAPARTISFGVSASADVRLVGRRPADDASSVVSIARATDVFEVPISVPGEAVALDLAAAIAAADVVTGSRVPVASIVQAVRSWRPPHGRAEQVALSDDVLALDDSYNANPASMRAALGTLAEIRRARGGRAIAVLGEMRELGPLTEPEHEALGEALVLFGVDVAIGCGGAIDVALRTAQARGLTVHFCASATDAGAVASSEVRAGDVVLFKGSRGAAVERALDVVCAARPRVAGSNGAHS